jgi:hypothetical protein
MDSKDAKQALEAMDASRLLLGQRAKWSFSRHAAFGLVMGTMVAAYVLPGRWPLLVIALCLAATALIIARDRDRDGMFVSGYRGGSTRWLTLGITLLSVAALIIGAALRDRMALLWAPPLLGLLTFAACTAGSMVWEKIYRDELGSDPD